MGIDPCGIAGDQGAVACFAVTQVAGVICIAITGGTDEGIIHILIIHTGGHIAGVPDAILFGIGQVGFVDGQGALLVAVNSCFANGSSRNTDGESQDHQERHRQGNCLNNVFHFIKTFRKFILGFAVFIAVG